MRYMCDYSLAILVLVSIITFAIASPPSLGSAHIGDACTSPTTASQGTTASSGTTATSSTTAKPTTTTTPTTTSTTKKADKFSAQECPIMNTDCINGKCQCIENYKGNDANDKCLPLKVNGYCTDTKDCSSIPNSECKYEKCVCVKGYEEMGGKCVDKVTFCFNDADCRNNVTHWCNETSRVCSCRFGYEGIGEDCVAPLNKPCTPEEGCIDPDADCVDFRCNCRSGLVADGNRCVGHHGTHIHLKARGNGEISVELDVEED